MPTVFEPIADEDQIDLDDLPGGFLINVCGYIAGWVVRKVLQRLGCQQCREVLVASSSTGFRSDLNLLRLKDKGGLVVPSEGVSEIVKAAELCLRGRVHQRRCQRGSVQRHATLLAFQTAVLEHISHKVHNLFPGTTHFNNAISCVDNHLFLLVKLILKHYFSLRQHHFSRTHNLEIHRRNLRYKLSKTILFSHD